jgi:hypothetical protein
VSDSLTQQQRMEVYYRSHGRCEALIRVMASRTEVWTRCYDMPVEVHHALTRGRGGDVLDRVGEVYHLIALCGNHHRLAHKEPDIAYRGGALIQGAVTWDHIRQVPVYTGPDEYLREKYPALED